MNLDQGLSDTLSPGEYLRKELDARGWSQSDLSSVINRPIQAINEIIQGKRGIMPEMAVALGTALGTGASIWLQREAEYRLSLISNTDDETLRRARLFDIAPVKEMEKRGWISESRTIDGLESELKRFFNDSLLDETPVINAAFRQTNKNDEISTSQNAWLFRAKQLASLVNARKFDKTKFENALPTIRALADSREKSAQVPSCLSEVGVRLVIIEALAKTYVDGAMFWLDDESPVVVLSLRYDRIDWFWHTLAHELIHIKNGDKRSVDTHLVGESRQTLNESEDKADKEASAFLIPPDRIKSFIIRTKPFYYKEKILQFAKVIGIHPGIVNGQLQHLKEIGWNTNREMLVKIRDIITTTALTDGWGKTINIKGNLIHE